jgi:hypothetical protein
VSASKDNKERADSTYVQRRNNREADQDRRKHILYGVVGGVIAVLAAALLVWDSGFFQKRSTAVTIDGEDFGPAVVQYYYQQAYVNAYYGAMMGASTFDPKTDPADQMYDEEKGQTWHDHLLEQGIDQLTQVTMLCHAAEEADYAMTPLDESNLQLQLDSLERSWRTSGNYANLKSYLKTNYGTFMDEGTFRDIAADRVLASSYQMNYVDGLTCTNEEVNAYYAEHTNELDTFGYSVFTVQAAAQEETDEDGKPVKKSDEEKSAEFETAKANALTLAQELQAKLAAGSDAKALAEEYGDRIYNSSAHISAVGSNFSTAQYADWLYDTSRKAGDITLAENDRSDSFVYNYYVVQFDSRTRDESSTADVRHILISAGSNPTEEQYAAAEESAQAILDQWKADGGTEDAFALLAMENTADSGSQATGGLYTGVSSANAWDPNFLDWTLDPARQSGDTGLVKNESSSTKGWHIMYFVGWNDPAWMYSVKTTLKAEDMSEWMDSLTADVEVIQGSGITHVA